MPLGRQHTAYVMKDISPISPHTIVIDRVFTNLLPLLKYGGYPVIGSKLKKYPIEKLRDRICEEDRTNFDGFNDYPDIVFKWLQSDFLDLSNRGKGKGKEAIASPIPLHINTYKLRSGTETKDFGVSEQVFSLLYYGATDAYEQLRDFLSEGAVSQTDKYDQETNLDIESLLVMRLLDQMELDKADKRKERDIYIPLCIGQARILGDDILRLLAYKDQIPRRVLIDYIKNIIALHIAIYMLRLTYILPDIVKTRQKNASCSECSVRPGNDELFNDCVFHVHFLTDAGDNHRTEIAEMARQNYNDHIMQHNLYIKAHFKLKKLHEFVDYLIKKDQLRDRPSFPVELLDIQSFHDPLEMKVFFQGRINDLMESAGGEPDPRLVSINKMDISEFEKYIEMLYVLRHKYIKGFFERLLESLFQRNKDNCMLRSGYGPINRKRYSLGSGLLETLAQIAILEPISENVFETKSLRIDEFSEWLEKRYGMYFRSLPENGAATITELEALRNNFEQFVYRLREIGFYQTLSDAYISQTIQPRYRIDR